MTKKTNNVGGAGARAGDAWPIEHAALCGMLARACSVLGLPWHGAQGDTDTQKRMAAFRAWLDQHEAAGKASA